MVHEIVNVANQFELILEKKQKQKPKQLIFNRANVELEKCLDKIIDGNGEASDLEYLESLGAKDIIEISGDHIKLV